MVNGNASKDDEDRPAGADAGQIRPPGVRPGGRTEAYPLEIRRLAIEAYQQGRLDEPALAAARQQGTFPSERTIRRYIERENQLGHVEPFARSGNRRARVLRRFDLVLLAIFVARFPTATGPEKIAFLYNAWGRFQNPPRFYDTSQISRAEKRIGISTQKRKKISHRAFEADV